MTRACIFVDGENFRHSLMALFQNGEFSYRRGEYLPRSDWHHFFQFIANQFECELLRTYWYVVEHVDFRPHRIPSDWKGKAQMLRRWFKDELHACASEAERRELMLTLEQDIENSRRIMEQRTKGWQEIYSRIENANNRLEFRRSGSITYDLVTKEFGKEKGVDTQLSTDLIELSGIYDVAILLSGDADYLPPVTAVKRKGRLVHSVSFLDRNGKRLPGGARRLINAVDEQIDLPFEAVRKGLGIEPVCSRDYTAIPSHSPAIPA